MKAILRIDEPASGARNMEVDEAMLHEAEHCKSLVLRVYRWATPTLSLGHFQRDSEIPTDAAWGQIDRVTRKTGGGAIVHDRELTYSLVIPHLQNRHGSQPTEISPVGSSPPSFGTKGPSELVYRAIHIGLVNGLREFSLNAALAEECTCKIDGVPANQSFLCFERRSPVDIVIDGVKVVGSAQRRTQFGLLQHGSILLRRSCHAPHLAGILDFLDSDVRDEQAESLDWEKWTSWLVKNLQVSLEKAFAGYWLFG